MNGEGGQESSKAEIKMETEAEMVSNRWVFAGGVYLCVQECQLTAERLVLKLHPQKRFPEALVNTEAFFFNSPPRSSNKDSIWGQSSERSRAQGTAGKSQLWKLRMEKRRKRMKSGVLFFCAFHFKFFWSIMEPSLCVSPIMERISPSASDFFKILQTRSHTATFPSQGLHPTDTVCLCCSLHHPPCQATRLAAKQKQSVLPLPQNR